MQLHGSSRPLSYLRRIYSADMVLFRETFQHRTSQTEILNTWTAKMASTDQSIATNIVSLDSPLRTTPIHPLLPDIRVPGRATDAGSNELSKDQADNEVDKSLQSHHYNPLTCVPFEFSSISKNQPPNTDATQQAKELASLREEHPTPEAALKAQETTAREAKRRIEETAKKREEVQRAIDKKVKERDTEMKVLEKYQEVKVKASDILPS